MVSATGKTARMVPYERQYDTGKDDFAIYFGSEKVAEGGVIRWF